MDYDAPRDHLLRVLVEEHLRDELVERDWWATTGARLGWTTDHLRIKHRARLRLLVRLLRTARDAAARVPDGMTLAKAARR